MFICFVDLCKGYSELKAKNIPLMLETYYSVKKKLEKYRVVSGQTIKKKV